MEKIPASRRDRARQPHPFLVTNLVNIRYLTGFTGSHAVLVLGGSEQGGAAKDLIITDGRYTAQVAQQAPDLAAKIERASLKAAIEYLDAGPVIIEAEHMSVQQLRTAQSYNPELQFEESTGIVEALRRVKDSAEVELLRQACQISVAGLTDLIAQPLAGLTEVQVARKLENLMFDHGASGVAFETIIASGEHSAIPHHRPTGRTIEQGDFVKIDFGASYQGYHADMTRTFAVGQAAGWQREVYAIVARAQQAALDAALVGAPLADLDATARSIIDEAGFGEFYTHSLGHGVGLEIHEAPGIGARSAGKLASGEVITIEPGIYLGGRGGVRIEDTVWVHDSGSTIITDWDKSLQFID